MYTLIILFYISLLGMIGMLVLKRHEVRTAKPSIISRLGESSDHIFHAAFGAVSRAISYVNKHTFIALAQWLAFRALVPVRKVYVEMKHQALNNPHSKKVVDAVRGKGEVKKHGASFYLRKIADKE